MTKKNPFLKLDRQIIGEVYTSTEAMDNLVVLCDEFGSRFGGTEGERQAAEFFKARMEAYGLSNVPSRQPNVTIIGVFTSGSKELRRRAAIRGPGPGRSSFRPRPQETSSRISLIIRSRRGI